MSITLCPWWLSGGQAQSAPGQPVTIPQILDASDGLAQSSVYRNLVVLEEVVAKTREQFGLTNPHRPEKPCAVVQLRRDNALGTLYNIVGFQTKLRMYLEEHLAFNGRYKAKCATSPRRTEPIRFALSESSPTSMASPKL